MSYKLPSRRGRKKGVKNKPKVQKISQNPVCTEKAFEGLLGSENDDCLEFAKAMPTNKNKVKFESDDKRAINERLSVVEVMLKKYPYLKKDKNEILNMVLDKKSGIMNDYILEKIFIGDKHYYIDPTGNLIDNDIKLVGMVVTDKNNITNIHVFSDIENINKQISEWNKFAHNTFDKFLHK